MSQEALIAIKVLAPAMSAALIVLLSAWRPWKRTPLVSNGHWGTAAAIGVGFVAAFYSYYGARGFQLQDRLHWMLPIVGSASMIGVIIALRHKSSLFRLLGPLLAALVAALLLKPPGIIENPMPWKIALGVMIVLVWVMLEPITIRRNGVLLPLAMTIVYSGLSIVLLRADHAGYSLMAAALSSICGMGLIIALLNRNFSAAFGGTIAAATGLATLAVIGWMYNFSDVPIWSFALIVLSPAMLWVTQLRFMQRARPWQSVVAASILVAVTVAIAVALAMIATTGGKDQYGY